jgi:hypothetical protein
MLDGRTIDLVLRVLRDQVGPVGDLRRRDKLRPPRHVTFPRRHASQSVNSSAFSDQVSR